MQLATYTQQLMSRAEDLPPTAPGPSN